MGGGENAPKTVTFAYRSPSSLIFFAHVPSDRKKTDPCSEVGKLALRGNNLVRRSQFFSECLGDAACEYHYCMEIIPYNCGQGRTQLLRSG